jgi:hypothetical protein
MSVPSFVFVCLCPRLCLYFFVCVCVLVCVRLSVSMCEWKCFNLIFIQFRDVPSTCRSHRYIHTLRACSHLHTYKRPNNCNHMHTNQTYRHTDIQTHRHTDIQTHSHSDIQPFRHSMHATVCTHKTGMLQIETLNACSHMHTHAHTQPKQAYISTSAFW